MVDPGRSAHDEDVESLLRPLYTTSWLIDDWLADVEPPFFGAEAVVLTSASSKTALGTAHALHARAERPEVVGLTSARNVGFVESLGVHDSVVTYDDVESLPSRPTVIVDMAGNVGEIVTRGDRFLMAGGMWYGSAMFAMVTSWQFLGEAQSSPYIGLRVCADYDGPISTIEVLDEGEAF